MSQGGRRRNYNGIEYNNIRILRDAPDITRYCSSLSRNKRFRQVYAFCLLCNNEIDHPIELSNIVSGNTKSCGCGETIRKKAMAKPIRIGRIERSFFEVLREVESTTLPSGRNIRWVAVRCHGPCDKPNQEHIKNWESVKNLLCISCGCWHQKRVSEHNLKDYSGERSCKGKGFLTAVQPVTHFPGSGNAIWLYKCDCGGSKEQDMGKWSRAISCGLCGLHGGRDSYNYFIDHDDWAQSRCVLYFTEINHGYCLKIGITRNLPSRMSAAKSRGMEYTKFLTQPISLSRVCAWCIEQYLLLFTRSNADESLLEAFPDIEGRFELRSDKAKMYEAIKIVRSEIDRCANIGWIDYYRLVLDNNHSMKDVENISSYFRVINRSHS